MCRKSQVIIVERSNECKKSRVTMTERISDYNGRVEWQSNLLKIK